MTTIDTGARHGRGGLRIRTLAWACAACFAVGLSLPTQQASAAAYLDAALGDVKPADKVVVAHPQPVQLLFQFETKGAPNARATKFLKDHVVQTVKDSGLFSEVGDAPTANGAVLSVIINDSPSQDDMSAAASKGFVTGLTFFVAGSTVREPYLCTVEYLPGAGAAKITRSATHAVYIQLGLINSPPDGAIKIGSTTDAVFAMERQIVSNPLNAIAADPGFLGGPPAVAPAAPVAATGPAIASSATPATPTTPGLPATAPTPVAPSAAGAPAAAAPSTPAANP
jgi:hypothetical protein